jgi:hypothetical protein
VFDQPVGQGDAVFVHTIDAQQAHGGTLHRGGGEAAHVIEYLAGNALCRCAGAIDPGLV